MYTYTQTSGELRANDVLIGTGYSGRDYNDAGEWAGGKNNPFAQNLEGIGPIPTGYYTATELIQLHPDLGPYVIHLEPDDVTRQEIESFGRDPTSFFMHGDSIDHPGRASHGCIVQSREVREKFWTSGDRALQVVSGVDTSTVDSERDSAAHS